jgi:very-short-patch-repair endonuclease
VPIDVATLERNAREQAGPLEQNPRLVSKDSSPESKIQLFEAFLYRRLETLPETAGRFRLNAELPIPFDPSGRMEVDFFCPDSRLVIELDGSQHLADAEAYRRDRRRDALLQKNEYFVLRFLAEDAGRRLDHILDTILATLVHRPHDCG